MDEYKKLEDYGIIGNLDTCALVGKDGSIDWCCFPHIESPSVFAGILDINRGGHFKVKPTGEYKSHQQYLKNTNILQTKFTTSSGSATLTDFMPIKDLEQDDEITHQAIFRKVTCETGEILLELDIRPKFNYARANTSLEPIETGVRAFSSAEQLWIDIPFKCEIKEGGCTGNYQLKEGESLWLILRYGHQSTSSPELCEEGLENTIKFWEDWAHKCSGDAVCIFYGKWHDLIVRSALILKLLTHHETGSISAAPTTSLPEVIGGVRNWDYRYNWIRDAAFSVQALYNLGHVQEAKSHLKWFKSICNTIKDPSKIQIMYGLHGEQELEEFEITDLSGYRNSSPVRIGNGAVKQVQLDIFGELINAYYETTRYGEEISLDDWINIRSIVDHVCNVWDLKDSGIWEFRSEPQHFVYSKLMCWVAVDRGIKIAELKNFEAPLDTWKETRDKINNAILEKGFNQKLNSFAQAFDSDILDATSLLIPMMKLLPFSDPRIQGTIDATIKYLSNDDGFVYRYLGADGLEGKEGAFILCSFWLINALTLSGRITEAEKIFNNILSHISPLGLLSEEILPESGELLGNYPQAFSHIGFINSALYLGSAMGRKQMGPEPIGK